MTAKSEKSKAGAAAREGDLLRLLPPVDECLRAAKERSSLAGLARSYLKSLIQREQARMRKTLAASGSDMPETRAAMIEAVVNRVELAAASDEPALKSVVNATGIVLHTNLGRAILPESAIEAVERAARTPTNLEFDLESGGRGDRDSIVERELLVLTGAQAATVVNNNAAAVMLALNTLAQGREVIVSRGELVEIGGAFRIPDVMAKSGAHLREVGTTNRTHPRDYVKAIGPETALLLKVHPSNYKIVGFTSEVTLEELVKIGNEHGIPVMEDLGAGALIDLSEYGLPHEPVVSERINAGAAIVTFSGDKLLGGPQAGVIAGTREFVARCKENPLKRALRCDKLTLAALAATLRVYMRDADLAASLPTLRLLRRKPAELRTVAERAREILSERLGAGFQIDIAPSSSEIGSGALATEQLESVALQVSHPKLSANKIAAMFRRARIVGRISDGAFMLDMRTIEDAAAFAVAFEIPSH
ncbi:MAG TPA: L-seryl-tRNA(Sec) selenium transferase [Candidatus Binataceae bacterium]